MPKGSGVAVADYWPKRKKSHKCKLKRVSRNIMHSLQLFIHFVQEHRYLGYALLYVAMLFEGELFLTAAGMLARLHAFDFFDAFFFAFAGVLTSDILWYFLGRYLHTHHAHNRFLTFAIHRVRKYLPGIENNPWHVIFISKFIYGLNHSTILVLGYLKIEFKHFIKIQFFTSLLWVMIFLMVGYIFGDAALAFTHRLDRIVIIAVIFFIGLIVVEKIIGFVIARKEQNKKNKK
jgi:membrane protein DedA with SNARE-associated domain